MYPTGALAGVDNSEPRLAPVSTSPVTAPPVLIPIEYLLVATERVFGGGVGMQTIALAVDDDDDDDDDDDFDDASVFTHVELEL